MCLVHSNERWWLGKLLNSAGAQRRRKKELTRFGESGQGNEAQNKNINTEQKHKTNIETEQE